MWDDGFAEGQWRDRWLACRGLVRGFGRMLRALVMAMRRKKLSSWSVMGLCE